MCCVHICPLVRMLRPLHHRLHRRCQTRRKYVQFRLRMCKYTKYLVCKCLPNFLDSVEVEEYQK